MSMDLAARALARRALKAVEETQGADAYEVAVAQGFVGTRIAWVASLKGPPGEGTPGKDAYEVAVATGFVGSRASWLASLVGPPGPGPEPETIAELQAALAAALTRITVLEMLAGSGVQTTSVTLPATGSTPLGIAELDAKPLGNMMNITVPLGFPVEFLVPTHLL